MKPTIESYKNKTVLLDTVIDNLPHAVFVLDADTLIVLANKMAMELTEKYDPHLVGLRGGAAFGCVNAGKDSNGCGFSLECRQCVIRNTVEITLKTQVNQINVEASVDMEHKGKKIFVISTTFIESDQLVILAMNDVTEAKKREEIQVQNQKLLAAVETGAAVCHEINQPLTVISGYIDLIEIDSIEQTCINNYISEMKISMDRLRSLSQKLMSLKKYHTVEYYSDTRILELPN